MRRGNQLSSLTMVDKKGDRCKESLRRELEVPLSQFPGCLQEERLVVDTFLMSDKLARPAVVM